MPTRLSLLTVASSASLALALSPDIGFAGETSARAPTTLAQDDDTKIPDPPMETGPDAFVFKPKEYKETPADVAECMKSWDPQTGMSKEEYEASCKRTLKYFPETAE